MNPGKRNRLITIWRDSEPVNDFEYADPDPRMVCQGWASVKTATARDVEQARAMEVRFDMILEMPWPFTEVRKDDFLMLDGKKISIVGAVNVDEQNHTLTIFASVRHG